MAGEVHVARGEEWSVKRASSSIGGRHQMVESQCSRQIGQLRRAPQHFQSREQVSHLWKYLEGERRAFPDPTSCPSTPFEAVSLGGARHEQLSKQSLWSFDGLIPQHVLNENVTVRGLDRAASVVHCCMGPLVPHVVIPKNTPQCTPSLQCTPEFLLPRRQPPSLYSGVVSVEDRETQKRG